MVHDEQYILVKCSYIYIESYRTVYRADGPLCQRDCCLADLSIFLTCMKLETRQKIGSGAADTARLYGNVQYMIYSDIYNQCFDLRSMCTVRIQNGIKF